MNDPDKKIYDTRHIDLKYIEQQIDNAYVLADRPRSGPLSDAQIAALVEARQMISPYEPGQISSHNGAKVISYGQSSYGYDIRIADEFFLSRIDRKGAILDPMAPDIKLFGSKKAQILYMPPYSFALGRSLETIKMPRNMFVICLGKSTYARAGLIVNVTPLEPDWRGTITLELSNTTPYTLMVRAGMGIAQLVFFEGDQPLISYGERNGKYMDQVDVTPGRV